ncbi:hypothetical protein GCM10009551_056210 [Nocardiopsis tropica]|uniref:Uncharacterized protein n=1 Tax=Streptomonospora nanhaiensis TaxID=1323731 RepID=A0ABY6YGN7_9ACTN|nr:hypothetical protein [Streptomonospora nanhaiensis]WAE71415.1 hypothetical protein OUQ99_19495 [Streptomonospora nanhaiensis]
MASTPELDQVAEARSRIAAHASLPGSYWVFLAFAGTLIAGLPIWRALLPTAGAYLDWGLVVLAAASAVYAIVRRRRTGVYLPRRVTSYPGARILWVATLAATGAGFLGIQALVDHGHMGLALAALVPVATVMLVGYMLVRAAMRRSIEAGRVKP